MRPLLVLAAVSFFLHLAWERAHIVLYTGYEALEGKLPVYVLATFGDVMYTLIVAGVLMLILGPRILRSPTMRDYLILALLGLGIAIFVEEKAWLLHRWAYTDAMLLVHGLGLSPLLQMTVLLPLSVYISTKITR